VCRVDLSSDGCDADDQDDPPLGIHEQSWRRQPAQELGRISLEDAPT
jgi:hypothetical protein